MRIERNAAVVGASVLVAYVVQAACAFEWTWLARQQANDTYRFASGGVVVAYLWWQWSARSRALHQLTGAFAPLVLYAHASHFAYGYLIVLALAYLGTTGVGLFYRPAIARGRRVFAAWFVVHLAAATLLLLLVAYHVVIAIAYE